MMTVTLGSTTLQTVRNVGISSDQNSFCNQVDLEVSLDEQELLEEALSNQELLTITLGTVDWRFLVERIRRTHPLESLLVQVWGRSPTAKLWDKKYVELVEAGDYENLLASAAVGQLASAAGINVGSFLIEDFLIPQSSLEELGSALPGEIISRICEAASAVVLSSPGGELIVDYAYPVPVKSLDEASANLITEWDDLLSFDEAVEPGTGENEILVEGTGSTHQRRFIIELDNERNNDRTSFFPGTEAYVRVYPVPGFDYTVQVSAGQVQRLRTYSEEVENEEIVVQDGRISTDYPIQALRSYSWTGRNLGTPELETPGDTELILSSLPFGCPGVGVLTVSYQTEYDLYKVTFSGSGKVLLCAQDLDESVIQTFSISFRADDLSESLSLEIDEERTGTTSPAPGAEVWIRAWTDKRIVEFGSTAGRVQAGPWNVHEGMEETVEFYDSDEASLQQAAVRLNSTEWLGRASLGAVVCAGKTLRAAQSGYGVLRVSYDTRYALLSLSQVNERIPVIVWAEDSDGRKGHLLIDFGEEGEEKDVYLVVKDFCSDLPVAGATVRAGGQVYGPTGPDGRVYLGRRQVGQRLEIEISAPGYVDSNVDALANDAFTVE